MSCSNLDIAISIVNAKNIRRPLKENHNVVLTEMYYMRTVIHVRSPGSTVSVSMYLLRSSNHFSVTFCEDGNLAFLSIISKYSSTIVSLLENIWSVCFQL
jgi:hypothetical protein